LALLNMGITFNVYGHEAGTEKIWPFDIMPRIIEAREWRGIEAGLKQRITALNLFIDDLYHDQKIVRDGVVPEYMVHQSSKCFLKRCVGLNPPRGIWCHITGTDLVRDRDGTVYVLEDNLRCPSGVSYVLENREVMKRTFPQVFDGLSVLPVEDYPEHLLEDAGVHRAAHLAGTHGRRADAGHLQLGLLRALFPGAADGRRTGPGLGPGRQRRPRLDADDARPERVDVIYRRIDDDFLDPLTFRPDSVGRAGLMDVYRAGRVALANAPGTGVADDKAVYAYVPQIIKYYLGEDIKLPQRADLYLRRRQAAAARAGQSRQAGDQAGQRIRAATASCWGRERRTEQLERYRQLIEQNPRNYIAQPMLALSRVPTVVEAATWKAGTSTCGPTSCTAKTSTCFPAG
jgi:uncharacterized circularly permuted ATP-grasp superfamily protein